MAQTHRMAIAITGRTESTISENDCAVLRELKRVVGGRLEIVETVLLENSKSAWLGSTDFTW